MQGPLCHYFIKYSIFTIALLLTIVGFRAPAAYFLIFMFAYPIVVSLWLHCLKEQHKIMIESSKDRWVFNINGVPVIEDINHLYNVHSVSENCLESIFKRLIYAKVIIISAMVYFAFHDLYFLAHVYFIEQHSWFRLAVWVTSSLYTLFMLYRLWQAIQLIRYITNRKWHIINQFHHNQYYYSAYYLENKSKASAYFPLLAIIFCY